MGLDLFEREEDKQAVSILVNWFRQMITHGRIDPADQAALATTLQSIEEVTNMLRTFTREKQAEFQRGRQWTRGHAGDPLNERVDRLANAAALTVTDADPVDVVEVAEERSTPPRQSLFGDEA